MRCLEKIGYPTEADAETARKRMVRQKYRGRALRWLQSFQCPQCFQWHIGHQRRPAPVESAAPQPKIPTTGELRRKLKRIEREWDRANQHRAKVIGQLIEADRIALETENEMREIQRQVTAMFLPAPR